ncbi:putative reverse transcriptase domain-containing protein [Tanacetum coccineum]|uniref:Reverse transcriptase domain-containing protein n=1 Tax=Tanacetum coccineum TaxID=301880 RepID=A0ABQ5F0T3_9ASTR
MEMEMKMGIDEEMTIETAMETAMETVIGMEEEMVMRITTCTSEALGLLLKRNDLTTYTRRFQELVLLCTRMVPDEEEKVERFIGGLPDNIQGNVIAAKPTRLQEAIRVANNLMDQKLKGYTRSAENKRRNCKRFGHMARDCTATVAPNTQRALVRNQLGIVCYECGRPGHYRKDCPKLRNQNRGNKTGNKTRNNCYNQQFLEF